MDRIAVAEWPISKFHLAAAAVSFFYLPLISFLLLYILLIFGFWKERLVYNKWDLTRRWCVPAMRRMWIFSTLHSPATKLFFFFRTLELNLCCVYIPSDALFLLYSPYRLARDDASTQSHDVPAPYFEQLPRPSHHWHTVASIDRDEWVHNYTHKATDGYHQ